ncbi:MAG: transaldolase family protein, partial [Planctomycetota bacterium]
MMATIQSQWLAEQDDLVHRGIADTTTLTETGRERVWQHMMSLGTESWLDTGDMQAADRLWDQAFAALTTNNTLLNKEIQTGCYDQLIADAAQRAPDADMHDQVSAIGLLLNVHHALRLVRRYHTKVSVELHTDLAHDVDATIVTAKQIHSIAPEHFIIKVPFTPSGLIAIRRLRED